MTIELQYFQGPSSYASTSKGDPYQTSRHLVKKDRTRSLSCRTTCIHPQLRDLLVCPSQAGELIAHSYHTVSRYTFGRRGSGAPGRKEALQALQFIPNVLAGGCGLLAFGGHTAELALRSTDKLSSWCLQTRAGKSINNSIHIAPSPSHALSIPHILVSNNDCHIYRYNLHFPKRWGSLEIEHEWVAGEVDPATGATGGPQLQPVDKIRLDTPINHTSISPDGRTMIAVGDTNQVAIFDISHSGNTTHIETIEVTDDASFSTSWSRTGEHFAVASQDGYVTIFDRRHLKPMKQFTTCQKGSLAGAARVVKYSQGPHELLAFSEQKNFVHIVDARTYEYTERLYLPAIEIQENQKLEYGGRAESIMREFMRHPLLLEDDRHPAVARTSTPNPWDTWPSDAVPPQPALDWRDCPPEDMLHLPLPPVRARGGYSASSASEPSQYWASSTPASAPRATVASILGAQTDDGPPTSSSSSSAGSTAVTGLDFDPSGRFLYASMEKIILEWEVDADSRRCHPYATYL